jgi:hypothetical protein
VRLKWEATLRKIDTKIPYPAAIAAVESKIQRIRVLGVEEVRALWRATFKKETPKALTRDLLVRMLCWHIQEQAFGGHSREILKLLDSYARGRPQGAERLRRLKPGTEIVREYQGERHTVVITAEGFQWRGGDYPSLTAIARAAGRAGHECLSENGPLRRLLPQIDRT